MATPFDATTKELVRLRPEDWLVLLGLPPAPCKVIDGDLATVSTEADRLIRVQAELPYLVHIEFQAGHDGHAVPGRLLRYNVLALVQTSLPVVSFVILLGSKADSPSLTGRLIQQHPNGTPYLTFEYGILRLWQIPVSVLLRGGLSTLPLALLCDLSESSPEAVVSQLEERIETEAKQENQRKLWASTYLLAGIRFKPEIAGKLLEKAVAQMKESMTYQHILAEGRQEGIAQGLAEGKAQGITQGITQGIVQGERELLLLLGTNHLGALPEELRPRLDEAAEPQLRAWALRLLTSTTWEELFS